MKPVKLMFRQGQLGHSQTYSSRIILGMSAYPGNPEILRQGPSQTYVIGTFWES